MRPTNLKKYWLFSLFLTKVGAPLFTLSLAMNMMASSIFENIMLWIFTIFVTGIFAYTIYRTAYKRPGTLWLSWCIVFAIIFMLSDIGSFIFYVPTDKDVLSFSVNILLEIWWCYLSIKLWRINKNTQFTQLDKRYWEALACLDNADDPEDLDKALFRLVRDWPALESFSSTLYNQRKKARQR